MRVWAIFGAVLLGLAGLYFALPLALTLAFSLSEGTARYGLAAYRNLAGRADLWVPLLLSLKLALATVALICLLLTPALIAIHLYAPRLRPFVEVLAALPFIVPAIAFVGGLSALIQGPGWLIGSPFYLTIPYFFLTLPYTYRALDVGLSTLDVRTLREAAESLGAGGWAIITKVILPNLMPALVNGCLLAVTVVMGEFTISNLLLFRTFPVFIGEVGKADPAQAAALSMLSFVLTWLAMFAIMAVTRSRRQAGRPTV